MLSGHIYKVIDKEMKDNVWFDLFWLFCITNGLKRHKKRCVDRESNPGQIVGNDLLYHSTISAWVCVLTYNWGETVPAGIEPATCRLTAERAAAAPRNHLIDIFNSMFVKCMNIVVSPYDFLIADGISSIRIDQKVLWFTHLKAYLFLQPTDFLAQLAEHMLYTHGVKSSILLEVKWFNFVHYFFVVVSI